MTFPYPYTGPIALYNNLPIDADFYIPNVFFIDDINRGATTTVTTTVDHNYVIGQLVRFVIPPANGIRQLNGQQGYVLEIPADDQAVIDINSIQYDAFITTSSSNQPQVLAIGNINSGQVNSSGNLNVITYIRGSYRNISPQ